MVKPYLLELFEKFDNRLSKSFLKRYIIELKSIFIINPILIYYLFIYSEKAEEPDL